MKNVLIAAALGLVASAPAHAVEPKPVRTLESVPVAPSSDVANAPLGPSSDVADAPKKPIRYCVMTEPRTGSRIWDKVCQTRNAWLKQGFDPLPRK